MSGDYKRALIDEIVSREDANGCWNVLREGDPHFDEWNYYAPTYSSTLWTLILAADIASPYQKARFKRPLRIMSDSLYDKDNGIFTIDSHFPIPCLNGNMLYLHGYFDSGERERVEGVVDFFDEHQRFDDGDFKTPKGFPYYSNKSCYGPHSCYWGVVKLLKGLSFIPRGKRSARARRLLEKCVEFALTHEVCYSSRRPEAFLHAMIPRLTFPTMYKADFLEVLWVLKRECLRSKRMDRALALLESKRSAAGSWEVERPTRRMAIRLGKRDADRLVDERAAEVYSYYR